MTDREKEAREGESPSITFNRWLELRCPKGDYFHRFEGFGLERAEPATYCPKCGAELESSRGTSVPIPESGSAVHAVRPPYPINRKDA